MKPSIGRIVHYRLSRFDAISINKRRNDARSDRSASKAESGVIVHVGNKVVAGEIVPMMITKAGPETLVNGQVTLDGNDSLWVLTAVEGAEEGNWSWPERV